MSCGRFDNPVMEKIIRDTVSGKLVLELGAGNGDLAKFMVRRCGARRVVMLEKEWAFYHNWKYAPIPGTEFIHGYLIDFVSSPAMKSLRWDVAVCSWPPNQPQFERPAIKIFKASPQVLVIAMNDYVTACGTNLTWEYLVQREVIAHAQNRHNDLMVYGLNPRSSQQPVLECEQKGLDYGVSTSMTIDLTHNLCPTNTPPSPPTTRSSP